jgi:kojibiose phosphorylase
MLGNGYLGCRGTFEEWEKNRYVACIVSDTYDTADGKWRELCNAPNGLYTKLVIANEEVSLFRHKVSHYKHSLNFKNELFSRQFRWQCEER